MSGISDIEYISPKRSADRSASRLAKQSVNEATRLNDALRRIAALETKLSDLTEELSRTRTTLTKSVADARAYVAVHYHSGLVAPGTTAFLWSVDGAGGLVNNLHDWRWIPAGTTYALQKKVSNVWENTNIRARVSLP